MSPHDSAHLSESWKGRRESPDPLTVLTGCFLVGIATAIVLLADLNVAWFFVALVPAAAFTVFIQLDVSGAIHVGGKEIPIVGTNDVGKIRNPLSVMGLTFITLGIYGIVWYYKTQRELAALGRARKIEELGTSPGTSLIAVTLGVVLIVPPFVSFYRACKRLNAAQAMLGTGPIEARVSFLFLFFPPIALFFYQFIFNPVLIAQAEPRDFPTYSPTII